MKKTALLLISIICLYTAKAQAQFPAAYAARLQVVFDSMCNMLHVHGASAAVLVPNTGTWKGVYGESEAGVPITPDMQFALNSNSKTYASTLIFKLQEMGLLTIDDTIGTWFPNQPNINGQITIRQLLNHTSGLYPYTSNPALNSMILSDFTQMFQPEDMLPLILAPDFAPGTDWEYCNTNYLLIGLIIRQVMAQPFSNTLSSLMLQPQGMNGTFFYPEQTSTAVVPHPWSMNFGSPTQADAINEFGYSNNAFYSSAYAAGGIFSTAEDNVKFWHALISGNIITPASFDQMRNFVVLDFYNAYGMGIFRYKNFNGHLVYSHGGTGVGYINENCADSLTGVCISVLTNQDSLSNAQIQKIVKALHKVSLNPPSATGVATVHEQINIDLYPNPTSATLHIAMPSLEKDLQVELANSTGQLQLKKALDSKDLEISVRNLPAGVYVLNITRQGRPIHTEKVLVEH